MFDQSFTYRLNRETDKKKRVFDGFENEVFFKGKKGFGYV